MNSKQRTALGVRYRQYAALARAGMSAATALAVTQADNPEHRKVTTAALAMSLDELVPASLPRLRARLEGLEPRRQGMLVGAAAEVLDAPETSASGSWVLYSSLAIACVVLVMFSLFVAPSFKDLFRAFGADLPSLTSAALFIAEWILGPVGLLMAVLLLLRWVWQVQPQALGSVTTGIDRLLFKLPILGRSLRVVHTKRLAGWLAADAENVSRQGLDCLAELAGPGPLSRQLELVSAHVAAGGPLADGLSPGAWLPGLSQVLKGASGDGEALAAYAAGLDARADLAMARLTLVCQMLIGALVGFFVIAMYLPIFKMGSVI